MDAYLNWFLENPEERLQKECYELRRLKQLANADFELTMELIAILDYLLKQSGYTLHLSYQRARNEDGFPTSYLFIEES